VIFYVCKILINNSLIIIASLLHRVIPQVRDRIEMLAKRLW